MASCDQQGYPVYFHGKLFLSSAKQIDLICCIFTTTKYLHAILCKPQWLTMANKLKCKRAHIYNGPLHTAHCTMYTAQCTLHTKDSKLHTTHCILGGAVKCCQSQENQVDLTFSDPPSGHSRI